MLSIQKTKQAKKDNYLFQIRHTIQKWTYSNSMQHASAVDSIYIVTNN